MGGASSNIVATMEATHKVSDNVTVSARQEFDSTRLSQGTPYDVGFNFTYKL